jgi:membrane fusion protein
MTTAERSLKRHILLVSTLSVLLVGGIGGWALSTTLSNAVVAEGSVVIEDNAKKVQHLTGGIVSELLVKEGAHVKAGDVLLRLDGTSLKSNLGITNSTLAQLYARRARLQAERRGDENFTVKEAEAAGISSQTNRILIEGEQQFFVSRRSSLEGMKKQLVERKSQLAEEIEGATLQIKSIDDSIVLIDEEHTAISSLYEKQLVTMQRVNTLKRQRAELDGSRGRMIATRAQAHGRINEINLQILQLDEDRQTENARDLTDVEAKIAESEERRIAIQDQLNRLDVRAPLDGYIYQLALHTVGGVANPGEALMLLSPETRRLTVEAKVALRSIDQLSVGQRVDIRFSAFDQKTTPEVQGKISSISPDSVVDQRSGAASYIVRIAPDADDIARLQGLTLYPGMPAEVFIKVADRSVISYLTKPMMDQINNTFRDE